MMNFNPKNEVLKKCTFNPKNALLIQKVLFIPKVLFDIKKCAFDPKKKTIQSQNMKYATNLSKKPEH